MQSNIQELSHIPQPHACPDSVNSARSATQNAHASPHLNRRPTPTEHALSHKRHPGSFGATNTPRTPRQQLPSQSKNSNLGNPTANTQNSVSSRTLPDVIHQQDRLVNAPSASQPASEIPSANSEHSSSAPTTQQAASAQAQPFTVDPSQVYDPWREYQRRKAAEEGQRAKKQAEDAERQRAIEEAEAHRVQKQRQGSQTDQQSAQLTQTTTLTNTSPTSKVDAAPDHPNSGKKRKKMTSQTEATSGTTSKGGRPKGSKSQKKQVQMDDEDAQMLAMLKAMKAKDPERFSRLMAADDDGDVPSTHSLPIPGPGAISSEAPEPSRSDHVGPPQAAKSKSNPIPKQSRDVAAISDAVQKARAAAAKAEQDATAAKARNDTNTEALIAVSRPNQTPAPGANRSAAKSPLLAEKPTIWPHEKKEQLARAAADYLSEQPENKGRRIHPHEIIEILDQNPSYILLCEQLEKKGLRLDRANFARTLLHAVPDVNNAAKKQRREQEEQLKQRTGETIDLTTTAPPHAIYAPPPRIGPMTKPVEQFVNGRWQSVYGKPTTDTSSPYWHREAASSAPASTLLYQSTLQAPVAQMRTEKASDTSNNAAASKEEAARKRNFNDLVDLTVLSDDEPESKRANIGPPSFHDPRFSDRANYPHFGQEAGSFRPHQHPPQFSRVSYLTQEASNWPHAHPVPTSPGPEMQLPPVPEKLRNEVIVTNISRRKARRRASYDPRSIARDVLLATGRHPDMYHLNAHLEGLRQRFCLVTDKADLETLRWDLIDPGDPLPLPLLEDDNDSVVADDEAAEDEDLPEPSSESRKLIRRNFSGAQSSAADVEGKKYVHSKEREQSQPQRSKLLPSRGRGRGRGRPPRSGQAPFSTQERTRSSQDADNDSPSTSQQASSQGFKAINLGTDKLRAEELVFPILI